MFRAEFPEPTPDKASQAVRGFYEEAQNSFTMIGKSAMIVQNFEQPHGYYISVLGAPPALHTDSQSFFAAGQHITLIYLFEQED